MPFPLIGDEQFRRANSLVDDFVIVKSLHNSRKLVSSLGGGCGKISIEGDPSNFFGHLGLVSSGRHSLFFSMVEMYTRKDAGWNLEGKAA